MPILHTMHAPLDSSTRPSWCRATAAGVFHVLAHQGRFDRHFHDCDEYWLVYAGKALVMSEGLLGYVQAGDLVCTRAGDEHDVVAVYEDLHAFYFEDVLPSGGRIGHLHRDAATALGHAVPALPLPGDFPGSAAALSAGNCAISSSPSINTRPI